MPEFDIGAAKREVAAEAEPIGLTFPDGVRQEFPGSMPAEFEIEQMAIGKDLSGLADGDPAPPGMQDRIMRAVFGPAYEHLSQTYPPTDLMWAMQILIGEWSRPFRDPNGMSQRVRAAAQRRSRSSSESSSTSFPPSKPTGSESTELTSLAHSGSNGSPGGGSSRLPKGSQGKR
ncbi:MAG: hypothetical protein LBJ87_05555 [bacterium]|jgi:hypothetical protein|nr:hypothetical protein [bacterium]